MPPQKVLQDFPQYCDHDFHQQPPVILVSSTLSYSRSRILAGYDGGIFKMTQLFPLERISILRFRPIMWVFTPLHVAAIRCQMLLKKYVMKASSNLNGMVKILKEIFHSESNSQLLDIREPWIISCNYSPN